MNASQYLKGGICTDCPEGTRIVWFFLALFGGVLPLLLGIAAAVERFAPRTFWRAVEVVEYFGERLSAFSMALAVTPKAKLAIAFFQTARLVPTVYGVHDILPAYYYDWMDALKGFEINWSKWAYPTACFESFEHVLLLRALGPLVAVALIVLISLVGSLVSHRYSGEEGPLPWKKSVIKTLPTLFFIAFVLIPGTSTSIFSAWTCVTFELDSVAEPATTVRFLLGDLSLECNTSKSDYSRVVHLATLFVVLCARENLAPLVTDTPLLQATPLMHFPKICPFAGPIVIPALLLLVLVGIRKALMNEQSSRMVRATAFLHGEYYKVAVSLGCCPTVLNTS